MIFFKTKWKKLSIFNYKIEPDLLLKYVPRGTKLNLYTDCFYIDQIKTISTKITLFGVFIPCFLSQDLCKVFAFLNYRIPILHHFNQRF